ncbi:MAG: DNA mismatch repair endonuclease MutL [Proteobacteria bacterium]|nr:DNA mismatch repair endonuclease MutL [Pseudomonadota bacterium]
MGSIRLLSEQVINRIAAGEVVERPAAVFKELIENSLDAGADRIDVEAEAGGRRLIQVSDNGGGMTPDDLLLAIERHATSKITSEADLLQVRTLGFRGEALASIGAVSRMTITSASERDGRGRRVRLAGGRVLGVEDAARDQGTTVDVRDLFFSVPARRKFLKSTQTEAAHLLEMVQRHALGRTELNLTYRHNGQEVLAVSPKEDGRTRLARVLGLETARLMFSFEGQSGPVALTGFLGRPELDRSRASGIYVFVNQRPVADRLLTRAVMEAYRGRLSGGRWPVAVVFLGVDPETVDVNVHPAKAEVRFRQPSEVFAAAVEVLTRALSDRLRPAAAPAPLYQAPPSNRPAPALAEAVVWDEGPGLDLRGGPETSPLPPDPRPGPFPEQTGARVLGQLFHSYILAQTPGGLAVVDQHAAHERVLFERLADQLDNGPLPSQALLMPETLDLTPTQAARLDELSGQLARFGFDLAPFGGRTWVLKAVPAALAGRDAGRVLMEILETGEPFKPDAGLNRTEELLLAGLACHGAVKAGQDMTRPEMDRLLGDLEKTAVPTHCPHGRPLIFHLSRHEIEKRFKRS